SLRKTLRQGRFEIRYDTAFVEVIRACASTPREGQDGTWINEDMIAAYTRLHARGAAHSAEAWRDGRLVGGLYGVALGAAFFGESMFSHEANASKATFVTLVQALGRLGYGLIDCQLYTDHLSRFGARVWPRQRFLQALPAYVNQRLPVAWPSNP
ncbi:leucyl/phenylalanyl-tRNA--protein transferase, partial [Myxococcota bacterium]|nr:leucyl/phenylalanyl-tRNA--protein transferase [Myxococcota bacterium]